MKVWVAMYEGWDGSFLTAIATTREKAVSTIKKKYPQCQWRESDDSLWADYGGVTERWSVFEHDMID
jgi:hypothetical protein